VGGSLTATTRDGKEQSGTLAATASVANAVAQDAAPAAVRQAPYQQGGAGVVDGDGEAQAARHTVPRPEVELQGANALVAHHTHQRKPCTKGIPEHGGRGVGDEGNSHSYVGDSTTNQLQSTQVRAGWHGIFTRLRW
jgi:hypothetical protein